MFAVLVFYPPDEWYTPWRIGAQPIHHVAHLKLRLFKEVAGFLADPQTRDDKQIFLNVRPQLCRRRWGLSFLLGAPRLS